MAKKDYYEILGISKNASKDDIKKAYKKLAVKYHPDSSGDKSTEEKFKELSEAYAVLSDDEKRKTYDSYGHTGFDQRYSREDIFRNADFSSIFDDIFGDESPFGDSIFNMFFGGSRRKRKGNDLKYNLAIDFEEAVHGTEKIIALEKEALCKECNGTGAKNSNTVKCPKCNGAGRYARTQRTPFGIFTQSSTCDECEGHGKIARELCDECEGYGIIDETRKIKIKIEKGIDEGHVLKVSHEGRVIKNGEPGDLYVVISIKPHEFFKREGNDIYVDIPISFSQAALGDEIEVPTLDGTALIKIPSGTQTDTVFRLKNKGIADLYERHHGDLFVRVLVKTPASLNKKQKELLIEFSKESKEKLKFEKGFLDRILGRK